jgi:hypothetical protein
VVDEAGQPLLNILGVGGGLIRIFHIEIAGMAKVLAVMRERAFVISLEGCETYHGSVEINEGIKVVLLSQVYCNLIRKIGETIECWTEGIDSQDGILAQLARKADTDKGVIEVGKVNGRLGNLAELFRLAPRLYRTMGICGHSLIREGAGTGGQE